MTVETSDDPLRAEKIITLRIQIEEFLDLDVRDIKERAKDMIARQWAEVYPRKLWWLLDEDMLMGVFLTMTWAVVMFIGIAIGIRILR